MSSSLEELRNDCIPWVREAGMMARERMDGAVASRKADASFVTDADQAVQDFLMDQIARRFPDDAVISEETQADPAKHASVAKAARCWVIDPIDGTRNYVRRVPLFTVSVALMVEGSPVVGFVYHPMTDYMYSASKGGGAWLNGRQTHVPEVTLGAAPFLAVPSGREEPLPPVVHGWIDRMVQRATGSTAWNLALVASGAMDAVFAARCKLWDMAAGTILVEEAGGVLTDHQGQPYFPMDLAAYRAGSTPFLAARLKLHQELLHELQSGAST